MLSNLIHSLSSGGSTVCRYDRSYGNQGRGGEAWEGREGKRREGKGMEWKEKEFFLDVRRGIKSDVMNALLWWLCGFM